MDATIVDGEEAARLLALKEYGFDAVFLEPGLERLVRLAATLFGVPIALISLIEAERQLFAARVGFEACETGLEESFCVKTIKQAGPTVVLDATQDPRFAAMPAVTGAAHVRFYASVPLVSPSGHAIGAFCIVDTKTRPQFTEEERRNLSDLAALALGKMESRRLEVARRASQTRFQTVAATSPDAIVCADGHGLVTFWSAAAARLLGYGAEEILGQAIDLIAPRRIFGRMRALAASDRQAMECRVLELDILRKDGTDVPVELSVWMWRERGRASFGAILRDISARHANEERLFRLAHLDPLTGLSDRIMLRNRIEQAANKFYAATVIRLDLYGLKDVNDGFGHAAGDAVLSRAAERLQACVRATDLVARVSGDEFAILVPGLGDPVRAGKLADAAIESITDIRAVEGQPVNIGASAGIAIYPLHGATAEELLSGADLALQQAKEEGRHCRRFFTPGLRQAAATKRTYQNELRRAREQDEFELFYQPQVRLSDGALVGAEALMRWRHPERGLLAPGDFMPALESGPLAAPLGEWTILNACRQAAAWRAGGAADFHIAVNLFGAQFRTGDLAHKVRSLLAETGLPPTALELEITENIILRHDDEMIEPLRELRGEGVGITFDDYGTGYASFSMLKRFPLTRLKIDRSFVHGMCDTPSDSAIVRAILYLGRSFGLGVIAEGVETMEQSALLRRKGCEQVQGFLIGRPMPAAEFAHRFGFVEAAPV